MKVLFRLRIIQELKISSEIGVSFNSECNISESRLEKIGREFKMVHMLASWEPKPEKSRWLMMIH